MEKIIIGAIFGAIVASLVAILVGMMFQDLALNPATSEVVNNVLDILPMFAPDPLEFILKLIVWTFGGGLIGATIAAGIRR